MWHSLATVSSSMLFIVPKQTNEKKIPMHGFDRQKRLYDEDELQNSRHVVICER